MHIGENVLQAVVHVRFAGPYGGVIITVSFLQNSATLET